MRSALLALAVTSGLAADGPPPPVTGVFPSNLNANARVQIPSASTGGQVDRKFFFDNPAADVIAIQAFGPNATNAASSLLLASLIDGQGFGGGGGYGGGYGGYPRQPSYPIYPPPQTYYPPYQSPPFNPWSQPSYQPSWSQPYQPSWSQPSYQPSWSQPSYQPSWSQPSYPYQSWSQPSYPRPRSPYPNPPNDPVKQAVLLSGIRDGTVNPLAAVSLDRDGSVGALGAFAASSLGNTGLSTALAVSGAFGNGNAFAPWGGTPFGNNGLGTLFLADAFTGGNTLGSLGR